LLILTALLCASCSSNESATQENAFKPNNELKIDDMQYWVSNYIAPSSLFFTVSEYKDLSSNNSIYYYYHPINRNNKTILITDKYMPFKRIIERNSQIISDVSLELLKNDIYYIKENGTFDLVEYNISQKGPFEYTLSSTEINIEEFGNFVFLDVVKVHKFASILTRAVNNNQIEVLEIIGNGFRRFKRKYSVETITNFETLEIYIRDIGLYYSEERFYYPQREGIQFIKKIDINELQRLLKISRMPFYYNNEP